MSPMPLQVLNGRRKIRSERREAIAAVLKVFLTHLDPATLWVGHWLDNGDFIPLDMATIASEAGLCRRRCERAISGLKAAGLVSVSPPQHHYNPVPYAGLRVIRAVTPALFEWAGLFEMLDQAQSEAIRSTHDDGGQP